MSWKQGARSDASSHLFAARTLTSHHTLYLQRTNYAAVAKYFYLQVTYDSLLVIHIHLTCFGPWRSIYDSVVILSMNDTFTENKCCNTDRNKYNNIIVWNVYKKIIAIRAIKNLLHLLFQYLQCPKETKPNHICRRAEFSKHCTQLWYCIWSDSREAEKNVPPVRHSRFWNWVDSS